jgi:hypothetical protein
LNLCYFSLDSGAENFVEVGPTRYTFYFTILLKFMVCLNENMWPAKNILLQTPKKIREITLM